MPSSISSPGRSIRPSVKSTSELPGSIVEVTVS